MVIEERAVAMGTAMGGGDGDGLHICTHMLSTRMHSRMSMCTCAHALPWPWAHS